MINPAKKKVVSSVVEQCSGKEMIFFVDFKGVTVAAERSLRVDLRTRGAKMKVAKARLVKIALKELGILEQVPSLQDFVKGQLALIISAEESQSVAKVLVDFQRKTGRDVFVAGGLYNNSFYDVAKVVGLAKIPSKQAVIQRLVCAINYPLTALARSINEVATKIQQ